ncbi:DNA-3-methyladenine glycosylase 2 family protein [Dermatophilaceae bacterium Sec6.4]
MSDAGPDAVAEWAPGRPVPLSEILAPLRRGSGDPTWRVHDGAIWRGLQTPHGPATVRMWRRTERAAQLQAWGPGAQWCAEAYPDWLGRRDDVSGFEVHHAQLRDVARRAEHWRVGRTGLVMEALVPAILEQRVTGRQAFAAYRALVARFGSVAPGPGERLGLRCPPDLPGWRAIPSWEWLRAGVDAQRADTVMRVLPVARRLEECTQLPLATAWRRLSSIPGVGVWTVAETFQRALGDADAVSFGDYHVAADIGWALTGAPVDDLALEALLTPYVGHRYRVQRLVLAGHLTRPRRGARITLPTHLP